MASGDLILRNVDIVGNAHRSATARSLFTALAVGDHCYVIGEHDNPEDALAVGVWYGAVQVGYLPKTMSPAIVYLLRDHVLLEARVSEVLQDSPWRVRIDVREA